jgi:hypothetical protein
VGPLRVKLCCRCHAHQLGKPLLMNGSSLLEGEGLIVVGLRTEKGSYLVEQATEAYSSGAVFEPAHRSIPLFDPAMTLLNGLITNDKFCLSRTSPSRVHWARRPP